MEHYGDLFLIEGRMNGETSNSLPFKNKNRQSESFMCSFIFAIYSFKIRCPFDAHFFLFSLSISFHFRFAQKEEQQQRNGTILVSERETERYRVISVGSCLLQMNCAARTLAI